MTGPLLRAERRIGELLAETVEKGGDRRSKSYDATLISRLPDDVTRSQSSRWQRVASIPEPEFESELARQAADALGTLLRARAAAA